MGRGMLSGVVDRVGAMYERLLNILNNVGTPKVLLVGDFMLDHYVYGNADRISPEAPVLVLNVTERQERPGGAGSVAADLATLGAETACVGVVGADGNGEMLKKMLAELPGINIAGLVTAEEVPTTSKQRIVGLAQHRHQQQLMRIDEECDREMAEQTVEQMGRGVEELMGWCDVVCVEDYNKGVLKGGFCQRVIEAARQQGKRVIVDPARVDDYRRYVGAWLIKPNRPELARATGLEINGEESWHAAAQKLTAGHGIANLVVTLDKQGAYIYEQERDAGEVIATRGRNVYDATGAGDMVLAMLGLVTGAEYEGVERPSLGDMVRLANVAGGLEVERFGCVGISRDEIAAELLREHRGQTGKLRGTESLLKELQWHRQQQSKVVFTNGCFDILHPGHISLLTFAKGQGDILVVAINSDRSVRQLKGPSRPILKEQDRAALLSALEAVDYIVIFDEDTPGQLIEQVNPDVLIKGTDWEGKVVGQEWVEQHGGKVALMPLMKDCSTSGIIEQVIKKSGSDQRKGR